MSSSPKAWSTKTSSASAATGTSSQDWAAFVAEPRNSPEAIGEAHRRAGRRRSAARRGSTPPAATARSITASASPSTARARPRSWRSPTSPWRPAISAAPGVGVNPLRGQNNVQGSCDMGSFPHELSGYRHISDDATRAMFESAVGRARSTTSRACASPTCSTPPSTARSRGSTSRARTSCSPIPTPSTSSAGLAAMECVVVQDLFLNETANYAHVFLPGSTFLEKDGTFTNAERRIQRVRKVMAPKNGYADWEITLLLSQGAWAIAMHYDHPSEIMDEIARLTPTFAGVSLREARRARLGAVAVQREGARRHADHAHRRLRARQGQVRHHRIRRRPTRRTGPRFPLLLTTGRILSQYNVGAQTRRTDNVVWHEEDRLEIHPHDAEQRGIRDGDWVQAREPRRRDDAARADHRPRGAGRRLHDLPPSRTRRPTSSPPTIPTGRPTAPNTR